MSSIQRLGLAAIALFAIVAMAPLATTTMTTGCTVCLDLHKEVETCEDALQEVSLGQILTACNEQCIGGPWTPTLKCQKEPMGGKYCDGAKENPFMFYCYEE